MSTVGVCIAALVVCSTAPGCFRIFASFDRVDVGLDSDTPDADVYVSDPIDSDAPDGDEGGGDADVDDSGDDAELDAPPCQTVTVHLVVEADQDDGEQDYGELLLQGESPPDSDDGLMMGFWEDDGPSVTWGFFRFRLTTELPPDADVQEARITLWGRTLTVSGDGWDARVDALRIWAESSADARRVTSGSSDNFSPSDRTLTDRSVRWPSTDGGLDWRVGADNTSSDISPLVQELVERYGGLAAGSHIQIWIRGDFNSGNREVGTEDWSYPEEHHAALDLTACM